MPFEPLKTDEPFKGKQPQKNDMDTMMLSGCTAFVASSVLTYGIAVWPFYVVRETHLVSNLGLASVLSIVPFGIFGGFCVRKGGLPGACGFISGALALVVFIHLRLETILLGHQLRDIPKPEFPYSWSWAVPACWLGLAAILVILLLSKREITDKGEELMHQ